MTTNFSLIYFLNNSIHPNYELKMPDGRKRKVNFITATKVTDTKEFGLPKYKKV